MAPGAIPTTGLTATVLLTVNNMVTAIEWLAILCEETGETQLSTCSGVPEFSLGRSSIPNGPACTFSTPGGSARNCLSGAHSYSSASAVAMALGGLVVSPDMNVNQS